MTTITVTYNDKQVQQRLSELIGRANNVQPAFKEIGEDMIESTRARFSTSTAPDGKRWPANSPVTIARYLSQTKGNFKQDGSLSKSGAARTAHKKPLVAGGKLATTINYQLKGTAAVSIGSNAKQAAMMQYGGEKSNFPHLWGNIPARPFIGVSKSDKANILSIVSSYLAK